MKMNINIDALRDTLKILGGVIRDTLDVADYRITVIVERKVDDKNGIVVDNIVAEKRLSGAQVEIVIKRFRDIINGIQ